MPKTTLNRSRGDKKSGMPPIDVQRKDVEAEVLDDDSSATRVEAEVLDDDPIAIPLNPTDAEPQPPRKKRKADNELPPEWCDDYRTE